MYPYTTLLTPNFTPFDIGGLQVWYDASNLASLTTEYVAIVAGATTATGVAGASTVTTSADRSATQFVGMGISIGGNAHTITSVSGTTIGITPVVPGGGYSGAAYLRQAVTQFNDLSGKGENLVQATDNAEPTLVTGTSGSLVPLGRTALRFDGAQGMQRTYTSAVVPATSTVFCTGYFDATTGTAQRIVDGLASHQQLIQLGTTAIIQAGQATAQTIKSSYNVANWDVFIAAFSGSTTSNGYVSALNPTANSNMGNNDATGMTIGRAQSNATPMSGFGGEFFVYNRQLSIGEILLAEQYLANKWKAVLTA